MRSIQLFHLFSAGINCSFDSFQQLLVGLDSFVAAALLEDFLNINLPDVDNARPFSLQLRSRLIPIMAQMLFARNALFFQLYLSEFKIGSFEIGLVLDVFFIEIFNPFVLVRKQLIGE